MYLAIHILKQDLLKVLKFDLLKKTSDFIYIMEIRGFLMNVTYLIYIQAKVWRYFQNIQLIGSGGVSI